VVLRWGIQRGYAVIPKSTNPKHLAENLDLFNFSLTQVEMEAISGLNLNHRFNDPGHFCGEAFNTHCPIYD
jgi:D-xylose reductase